MYDGCLGIQRARDRASNAGKSVPLQYATTGSVYGYSVLVWIKPLRLMAKQYELYFVHVVIDRPFGQWEGALQTVEY